MQAAANLDKVLSSPDHCDSMIGKQGMRQSGGEIHRSVTAQVLLSNFKTFLLNQAASAVDTTTEASIQKARGRSLKVDLR
jgi:ABC-type transport system involved in Fe-S cluster assembly fused permease/ATPase subunit